MPFDDEDNEQPSLQSQKVGLKNVSSKKSMFDAMPKKPNQEDLNQRVQQVQDKASGYKAKTADLAMRFQQAITDKTLSQNKNMFQKEIELELLRDMIKLAQEINSNPLEREGEGSLSWITLLLKTTFNQRDKINNLEYQLSLLNGKVDTNYISELISKEIAKALDASKKGE